MTLKQFCFSFTGRIDRKLYWAYVIVSLLMTFCFYVVIDRFYETVFFFMSLLYLLVLYIDLAVTVKRLHDTNRSGWNAAMVIIPIIGVFYLIIVCGFFKGIQGENRYGPPVDKII